MSERSRFTKKEFVENHEGQEYRYFRCTGSQCSAEVIALAGANLWCGTPGCKGFMKPSHRASSKKLGNQQYEAHLRRAITPRFTPRFLHIFGSQKPQNVAGGPDTPEGSFEGLIQGANQVEDLLLEASADGSEAEIRWARPISRDTDE